MGGNKSKPIAESARQVLAKRTPVAAEANALKNSAASETGSVQDMKINVKYTPEHFATAQNSAPDVNAINSDIISEISKWSTVKQTTVGTQVR
jgi:hypothetical protein